MLIGYARIAVGDEDLSQQMDALRSAGCAQVYADGHGQVRQPELGLAVSRLGPGDVLVVPKLDRLGHGLGDVLQAMKLVELRGAHLRSLADGLDTTTATGGLLFRIAAALADVGRTQRGERARRGMSAAKERGRHVGRPPKLSLEQVRQAEQRVAAGEAVASVAAEFHVSALTLRRAFEAHRNAPSRAELRRTA
jgi:DNA invertase Pin-like site-specific DNA recombinase